MDYVNGIKIYEAIVESKILETTQKQIQTLEKEANKIISETTKVLDIPKIVSPQNNIV
jgi:23S rRNA maturation mini-RNase III